MREMARTRQKQKPNWHKQELSAWKPPDKITVSENADRYRILDIKTSAGLGKWKTSKTPYLEEIMNTYHDPYLEEVVFCKPTQVGGSEGLNNILLYIIAQDPSPTMLIYPSDKLAKWVSKNRLQPMIKLSEPCANKYLENESQLLELQFTDLYIGLTGANSPANLASRPVKNILIDEADKIEEEGTEKEADPINLARERTKTFKNRKFIFITSTPTIELGNTWSELMKSDVIKQFYVQCPHCGEYWNFKLDRIKWNDEINQFPPDIKAKLARDNTFYACECCGQKIYDHQKAEILKTGEWRPVKYVNGKFYSAEYPDRVIRKVGYQLNTIYSPFVTFGEVAEQWILSQNDPKTLKNFINSWLGEPWRDKANPMKVDIIMTKMANHHKSEVPEGTTFLTAGVDVQKDHWWWEVRAFGPKFTSWLVDYGVAWSWAEVADRIVHSRYRSKNGKEYLVKLAGVDTGYNTDEAYQFCAMYPEVCLAFKGDSKKKDAPYSWSNIDKVGYTGLKLWIINTNLYKDMISGRIKKPVGETGSWMLFDGCPQEYANQIASEQKIVKQNKRGKVIEEWVPVTSHADNHLLDCDVYAHAAAEIAGIRFVEEEKKPPPASPQEKQSKDDWIPDVDW